jgi:F-box-like
VRESKDAVIEAKDKLLAKQKPLDQQPDAPASSSADTAAQRLAAAEPCDRKQKRARQALKPLDKDEILGEIFSFVGRKEWLYVGAVCRRWRARYLSMCYAGCADNEGHAFQTSHRSAFATAARFSIALDNGLKMPDEDEASDFFDDLPKLSQQPIDVLTLARVHGAAWHEDLCRDAALFGDLKLLQWLHKSGCPWDILDVARHAVRSTFDRPTTILPWLFSTLKLWSHDHINLLLFEAGTENNIPAAKLMLQQGAEWPSSFNKPCSSEPGHSVCWGVKAVSWARAMGRSWGEWKCQDLAPELYSEGCNRKLAAGLFRWAHRRDCPCTCEAATADDGAVAAV